MATRETALHPTPWRVEGTWLVDAEDFPVGKMLTVGDAERTVAAVNACTRIPTTLLRDGVVGRLVERHADKLEAEVPGLREILKAPSQH